MLVAKDVSFAHGGHVVLDRISLSVGPGTRIGLVGPNGIGKTTLLRVLAGDIEPDGGSLERSPRNVAVGYLPQEVDTIAGETLRQYLARRTGVAAAEAELQHLTDALVG